MHNLSDMTKSQTKPLIHTMQLFEVSHLFKKNAMLCRSFMDIFNIFIYSIFICSICSNYKTDFVIIMPYIL